MLEIARLFAAGPRPQRTLALRRVDGEERGLLGSEYYAQHPLFPMETMAANLTFDTLQFDGAGQGRGAGRARAERDGAIISPRRRKTQGRYVTPENHPERGLFYRADHFSFAKRGVPVLLDMALAGAYDMVDGGRAAGERWLDAFTAHLLPPDLRRLDAGLEPGRRGAGGRPVLRDRRRALANSRDWPQWMPTSEFAKVREQSASARSTGRRKGERGR